MAMKYYFDLLSQPSRAVYIFLKTNKIPFEEKPVALRNGVHLTEDFKKLNPFSKVPFIDDGGFVLTESVAILKYLACKHKVDDHWYPRNDLKQQACIDEYMNWQHTNIRFNAAMTFQHLLIIPRASGNPVNEKKLKIFKKGLSESLFYIDTKFLNGKSYLCGDDISIADILGACELMQLNAVHEENFYLEKPAIKSWIERVKQRLNPHFDDAHKVVRRAREVYPSLNLKANL